MRAILTTVCLTLCVAGSSAAWAEPGSFFKNMLGGGGDSKSASDGMPAVGAPKLYDPNDVYCPNVAIRDGAAALQVNAGAAGDGSRLRHQITFARLSRECGPRPDGTLAVKVGVELRALLGPAGAPGSFEAPLTITVKVADKILDARMRRVHVTVPAGAAQGTATVVEEGLIVPAVQKDDFDIEVALGGAPAKSKAPKVAARRTKPARTEASAEASAPTPGE